MQTFHLFPSHPVPNPPHLPYYAPRGLVPFPPLVFPDSAKAGLNFHSDQAHLFGECPGEPSQYKKVLLMVFFDHKLVAVSPRVSSEEGVRPPAYKVCGGTALLFHGDARHATSVPDDYRGGKTGMQF